jgi:hypothetical protein
LLPSCFIVKLRYNSRAFPHFRSEGN